jgi:hypothetical protein
MAKQPPKPPAARRSGWAATGRLGGGRRSLTVAQLRGMRRQLTDLDASRKIPVIVLERAK